MKLPATEGANPSWVAPAATATFALTPGHASDNIFLHFNTKEGSAPTKPYIEPFHNAFNQKMEQVVI